MEIKAKEIKLVPLSEIKLNPKNRNAHPDSQVDHLIKIMEYQGIRRPGTISNRSGLLVCGEGRYLAIKKTGGTHMPVMFQDYDDEAQEFADGVADNAIDKQAILDFSGINQDIIDFGPDFDLDLLGLPDFKVDVSEKEEKPKEKKEKVCPHCGEPL